MPERLACTKKLALYKYTYLYFSFTHIFRKGSPLRADDRPFSLESTTEISTPFQRQHSKRAFYCSGDILVLLRRIACKRGISYEKFCLTVRLSHSFTLSKRLNVLSFFSPRRCSFLVPNIAAKIRRGHAQRGC